MCICVCVYYCVLARCRGGEDLDRNVMCLCMCVCMYVSRTLNFILVVTHPRVCYQLLLTLHSHLFLFSACAPHTKRSCGGFFGGHMFLAG